MVINLLNSTNKVNGTMLYYTFTTKQSAQLKMLISLYTCAFMGINLLNSTNKVNLTKLK